MNTASARPEFGDRWIPYFKAAGFLVPAILLWSFAAVFLFPKLQWIWSQGGGTGSESQWLMEALGVLMRNDTVVVGAILVGLALVEWLLKPWARIRRPVVGTLAFLLNALVLLGLTAMCIAALLIAPALMQAR